MTRKILYALSKPKLKYFIADEKKAVNEYKKYGLTNLAKEEKKHFNFLKAKLKKVK